MELVGLDWPRPSQVDLERARLAVLVCLQDENAASRALAEFYDPLRGYGGRTFLDLQPVDPWDITVADMLSVTMLNVTASPLAARRLLGCGIPADDHRTGVLAALMAVDSKTALVDADVQTLQAAAQLYTVVKVAIGMNPWVVASKLCARKRPSLIPVRDRVIVATLKLANRDFRTDWMFFRHLLEEPDLVASLLAAAHRAITEYGADLTGSPTLRLLDTILWKMRPKKQHPQPQIRR